MRVSGRLLVLIVLVSLAIDFAMLDQGAFQFNVDESLVAMRAEARAQASRADLLDVAPAPARADVGGGAPTKTRITVAALAVPRSTPPAARSRLIVSVDTSRSAEDH